MTTSLRCFGADCRVRCCWPPSRARRLDPATTATSPQHGAASDASTRPATTTFFGDTGLWFVPTGEVLAHGKWSVSGYRRGTNWVQGYTNVADFAGTFGVGIKDRAEIFGSFLVDTRIDRDVRPVFVHRPEFGGFVDRYPRVNQVLDRRQHRRLLRRRRSSTSCRSTASNRRRSRCAAWSSCRPATTTRASAPGRPTSRSTSSSARKRRSWSKCRASAATNAAAARTTSTFRAARSAGAPASASRRATGCASPAS